MDLRVVAAARKEAAGVRTSPLHSPCSEALELLRKPRRGEAIWRVFPP